MSETEFSSSATATSPPTNDYQQQVDCGTLSIPTLVVLTVTGAIVVVAVMAVFWLLLCPRPHMTARRTDDDVIVPDRQETCMIENGTKHYPNDEDETTTLSQGSSGKQ